MQERGKENTEEKQKLEQYHQVWHIKYETQVLKFLGKKFRRTIQTGCQKTKDKTGM